MPTKRIALPGANNKKKRYTLGESVYADIELDVSRIKKAFTKATIRAAAKKAGFIQRKRSLDAYEFFLAMTFGSLRSSTVTLSSIIEHLSKRISRAAVHERFGESACVFLQQIARHFLTTCATEHGIAVNALKRFDAIKIIDSSSWMIPHRLQKQFPGYNGAGCKIQLLFDYKTFQLSLVELTQETDSDQSYAKGIAEHINANELFIGDQAYIIAECIEKIDKKRAFF